MSTENKEFYDLLNSVAEEQTFSFELCPRETPVTATCRQLNTSQLKELIKSAVDSPLTQSVFNGSVSKIFKQSLISVPDVGFNTIDRLLFVLETRIQAFSSTKEVKHEDKTITINFQEILSKLKQQLTTNLSFIQESSATEGKISITFGVPQLHTEDQINEELYKNLKLDVENTDELRKLLGEAFINEIAKTVQTITIGEKTMDLSTVTFKSRLKAIESLPALLIQKTIEYVERYKKVIEDCLTVEGYTIPIDSTIFSLR